MNWKRNLLMLSLGLAAGLASLTPASAATPWERDHPRRTEVLGRTANQSHRINEERREGDLTAAQAHRLHAADRGIVRQEQYFAHENNGHITKPEQRLLNREENAVGRHIPD
ncbi:MAG TPA: hypothetical protein VNH44_06435 [Micropepsaceae bacterium]|nr:hypothetical protein [Micropepsaceae bacterium]